MKSVHNCIITAVTAMSLFTACAAMEKNDRTQVTSFHDMILSVQHTVSVGETIIQKGVYAQASNSKFSEELAVDFIYGCHLFDKCNGNYEKYKESELFKYSEIGQAKNKKMAMLSDPYGRMKAFKEGNNICIVGGSGEKICKDYNDFERFIRTEIKANDLRQSLIYKGRIGNKIKIEYREFSKNSEQSKISNELEYNLDDSNIIAHKGAKIEVMSATAETIRFKVVSNFSRVE